MTTSLRNVKLEMELKQNQFKKHKISATPFKI